MRIEINGCNLFFDVYGSKLNILPTTVEEKPTLIVLHGGPGAFDHTICVEFWSQFADIAQVILIDQRGCGRSDHCTPDTWNLAQWADDLAMFCKTLGIQKPIIAGISMGGHVMCEYASRYPEQPGGLIFCNTEARFIVDDIYKGFKKIADIKTAEIARDYLTNPTPETAADYMKYVVSHYAKNAYTPTEIARGMQNMPAFYHYFKNHIHNFDYLDTLDRIQCPTLLMVGADSPLHLPIRAEEMAAAIKPQLVTLHSFKGAGGPVYKDSPQESERLVREFLQRYQQTV